MKTKLLALCLVALGMFSFTTDNDNDGTRFRDGVNVFRVARILDKPVMFYIGADYCERSQRMNDVFLNKDLGCFLNEHFICKRLNASNPLQILRANNWGITDVPSVVFFNSDGKQVYTISGLKDAEQMIEEAQKALDMMHTLYVARLHKSNMVKN